MGKESKEMQDILDAIERYVDKHKGNVLFHGSFCAFKGKDCDIQDDRIFAYGDKKILLIQFNNFFHLLKKEKTDFINW